jgi:oligopeptide/dipeptide ABC transporter ATP-binding protein
VSGSAEESKSAAPEDATRREQSRNQETLLRVEGLCTWFPVKKGVLRRTVGHVRAVDGVDLRVRRGSTLALVGESGCGKTTVGRSILRLVPPTRGKVLFEGADLAALPEAELRPYRRHIQMVFQDPMTSLDPRLRVRDIIAEGMEAFGIGHNDTERTERAAALLAKVQLSPDHLWRFPHQFSGGQRQRIGIARALAVEPKLLICDEAVSALDVSIQAQILNLLGQLRDDLGLTYLFITHDLGVVRYLADEVAVMYLGRIVETGSTEGLFAKPQHPYTQGLLAAVPSVDPDERRIKARVLGDVPSPEHPPLGCRFHTRCPFVFDRCPREEPELYAVPGGQSRCFLNDPDSPKPLPES